MARRIWQRRLPETYIAILLTYGLIIIPLYLYLTLFSGSQVFDPLENLQNSFNLPHSGFSQIMESPLVISLEESDNISKQIRILNAEQRIYNLDLFGPVTSVTNVVVIQVHTRVEYLKLLLDSLRQVKGIQDSLLIFSHDVFLPSLNDDLRAISFTRVMQIFYPYSLQLNPGRFPGIEENNNTGYDWSPRAAQIKLHWWWKLNFVFDKVRALKNFSGVISFTEEDTYVTENWLWMLNLMERAMVDNRCGGCQILSLTENPPLMNRVQQNDNNLDIWSMLFPATPDYSELVVSNWVTNLHLAFNRTIWKELKQCSRMFCKYNDYNWDWTLRYLTSRKSCMEEPLRLLSAKWPRVFHTGDCGYHYTRKRNCDPKWFAGKVMKKSKAYSSLFPKGLGNISSTIYPRWMLKPVKPFGGWGHPRIAKLCMAMVKRK